MSKLIREIFLVKELKDISSKYQSFSAIRSAGLWIGCDLLRKKEINTLLELCYKHGLIAISAGSSTLRLAPALNISQKDLEEGLSRLDKALFEFKT